MELNTGEVLSKGVIKIKSNPMPKQMPSVLYAADKDVSESDSDDSTNQLSYNADKPIDMRHGSLGMSGSGINNEARDEYDFWYG